MNDYESNTTKVLEVLKTYNYPRKKVDLAKKCYDELAPLVEANGQFSKEQATSWCESAAYDSEIKGYVESVVQLGDMYLYGRILGSHLKIYHRVTQTFIGLLVDYRESYLRCHSVHSLGNVMSDCSHFLSFLEINGIHTVGEINYPVLELYHRHLTEATEGSHRETNASSLLKYLIGKDGISPGFSLYMRNASCRKLLRLTDFSDASKRVVEDLRAESQSFPANEIYDLIPDYVERIRTAGYSKTVVEDSRFFLEQFYLFIDREQLGYDYGIALLWIQEVGPSYGITGVIRCRGVFEKFDEYTREGDLVLDKKRNKSWKCLDTMPPWYKDEYMVFIEKKRKEGKKESTIRSRLSAGVRFCRFLESVGVESFASIKPEHIKKYNAEDVHKTIVGKNDYNKEIRAFLVHLELRHVVQEGLHFALPTCHTTETGIIECFSSDVMERIAVFCENAQSACDIRDVAMIKLCIATGLRPVDIVGLRIENIDFEKMLIRFCQSKTNVPHICRLDVDTMNAIFRYLRDARPRGLKHDYVFVSMMAPHKPLSREAGVNALRRAGVPEGGFARLRKTFATNVVKGGKTIKEAAELLGHSNSNTVHRYINLDEKRMHLCPLSIDETGLTVDGRYRNG